MNDIEVEASSGNVFADLALADADSLKIKSGLVVQIRRVVRDCGLTVEGAARRMGLPQSKVLALLNGEFLNFSERKLMDCLNQLGSTSRSVCVRRGRRQTPDAGACPNSVLRN